MRLLLILWLILSSGYIGWSIWNNVRNNLIGRAYQQGVADTVGQLIQEAENTDCKPVKVFNQEQKKEVELVNVKCLTKAEPTNN